MKQKCCFVVFKYQEVKFHFDIEITRVWCIFNLYEYNSMELDYLMFRLFTDSIADFCNRGCQKCKSIEYLYKYHLKWILPSLGFIKNSLTSVTWQAGVVFFLWLDSSSYHVISFQDLFKVICYIICISISAYKTRASDK